MAELTLKEQLQKTISNDKWQRIGFGKRAGVLAPLFSLYSKDSLGIGEFCDIKLLVDWCVKTGNSIIQLLPMNEVGPVFCPYDSVSSFALEPAYICLRQFNLPKSVEEKLKKIKKLYPTGSGFVNYGIKEEKLAVLKEIFQVEDKDNLPELDKFKAQNAYWLLNFALFKTLKDHHQGKPWYEWEEYYKNHNQNALDLFAKTHKNEIDFQIWLQWQLFRQFSEVKQYAISKNVFIKGDLPILVSRDSADVWAHAEFFKLEFSAGAPPDMYCAKGQRWGMPTYNWEKIAADSFRYLKEKLRFAQNFYDILRIDHVVGLFRIWSINYSEPLENQGLHGSFDPKDEHLWMDHGRNLLTEIINETEMLLCAEDLGVIPKACTDGLGELGIPGNDVQRWVKDWHVRHDFLMPQEFRQLSVAMLSTHDTTNWAAWWENEASTVDEALFTRKCKERGIDFLRVKEFLFDAKMSGHGRLRWLKSVDSHEKLTAILEKRKDEVGDFIDMYENTYQEKEKLWKHFKLSGLMREKSDRNIVAAALKITLSSRAVFCIELITDWLYLADLFKGDPYQYRVNTPGTVEPKNWSLTLPFSLEDLLKHKINNQIKQMVVSAQRKEKTNGAKR